MLGNYLKNGNNQPFVVYGRGGSGKTALLSQLCKLLRSDWESLLGPQAILILRFCGSTPDSNSVVLLLKSICLQLSYNYNMDPDKVPEELAPLVIFLREILASASSNQPILIVLDSIDEISTDPDKSSLSWLPTDLPKNCKFLISVTKEPDVQSESHDYTHHYHVLANKFRENMLELPELGPELGLKIIYSMMEKNKRILTNFHNRLVLNSLEKCSLPVFCRLIFAEVVRWKSYTTQQNTFLASSVTEAITLLFSNLEEKHGWFLVAHTLSYVTAAKNGITDSEMDDLLSLDDEVLDDLFQYHLPPTRRVPPLLWTRLRADLPGYLVDSEADGVLVTNWYHRQFREAAKQRYLSNPTHFANYHNLIGDFFLGTYGGGVPKPFRYTEQQRHRFGLRSKDASEDRKVPDMPMFFGSEKSGNIRYNLRKLGELPFHLVRSGRLKDLASHCLFNYDWLHAKLSAYPLSGVLSDFEDAIKFMNGKN